jgi:hypothetical protein
MNMKDARNHPGTMFASASIGGAAWVLIAETVIHDLSSPPYRISLIGLLLLAGVAANTFFLFRRMRKHVREHVK